MSVDVKQARRDADGFKGRFEFQPEHTIDRGIGDIADFEDVDDRLVFIPEPNDFEEGSEDGLYTIAEQIEAHVAEPLARMLNTYGTLVDEIEQLKAALNEACDLAVELSGWADRQMRSDAKEHLNHIAALRRVREGK